MIRGLADPPSHTRLRFERSDLRPNEWTTNIGLFKAGTGSVLEFVNEPLLTQLRVRQRRVIGHLASGSGRTQRLLAGSYPPGDLFHGETDSGPRPAGRLTPRTLQAARSSCPNSVMAQVLEAELQVLGRVLRWLMQRGRHGLRRPRPSQLTSSSRAAEVGVSRRRRDQGVLGSRQRHAVEVLLEDDGWRRWPTSDRRGRAARDPLPLPLRDAGSPVRDQDIDPAVHRPRGDADASAQSGPRAAPALPQQRRQCRQ